MASIHLEVSEHLKLLTTTIQTETYIYKDNVLHAFIFSGVAKDFIYSYEKEKSAILLFHFYFILFTL